MATKATKKAKRPTLKQQLAAALKENAELREENARLRGPAPPRVGSGHTPPKSGRLTKAELRKRLLSRPGG
jgi:hypothetical protein